MTSQNGHFRGKKSFCRQYLWNEGYSEPYLSMVSGLLSKNKVILKPGNAWLILLPLNS